MDTSKAEHQQQPSTAGAEESKVVLRRRERSLASRRLVKSMYAESTCIGGATRGGMVDSLLSDSVTSSDR